MRFSRIFFLPLVVVAAAACNDTTGTVAWSDVPDTVTLYSASRADLLGHPSAFDPRPMKGHAVEVVGRLRLPALLEGVKRSRSAA